MLTNTDMYLFGFLFIIIAEVFFIIKKIPIKRNLLFLCLFVYLTLVFSITFFPIVYQHDVVFEMPFNLIPFASISASIQDGVRTAVRHIAGNILMFFPLGMLMGFLLKNPNWKNILLTAVLFSIGIEAAQWLIGLAIGYQYRQIDIDDVLLNIAGACIGYGFYKILPSKMKAIFKI